MLEKHYRDMQDMEFRSSRQIMDAADPWRQAHRESALRIAVELANEGVISKKDAVSRIDPPRSINCCIRPSIPRQARSRRHRPAGLARCGRRRNRVSR